jgi:ribonuclease BN (tRNA processing enzyme)
LKLTVVGCAPAYSSRSGRASSGYLVEHGITRLMLDFGLGSFSELWRYATPGELTAIAISHLHADHNVDLIPLRHWVKYENDGRGPTLHAPAELRRRMTDYQRFVDPETEPDFLACLPGDSLEPGSFRVGELLVEAARVTHIRDSFAFRVSIAGGEGPGLVYSGDCAVADDLLPLIRPGDTVLCEAAFGVGPSGGGAHLTATEAAGAAARGVAARLVLTHILDGRDEAGSVAQASGVFSGPVEAAQPGLTVDIS